jgi:hypothetical protein
MKLNYHAEELLKELREIINAAIDNGLSPAEIVGILLRLVFLLNSSVDE